MITAVFEGRSLRLAVEGAGTDLLVRPLPWKRGRALAAAFVAGVDRAPSGSFHEVLAEALGAENYSRITGDHVQEFDEFGLYVRTTMPEAVMVEPAEDLLPPRPDQRFRVLAAPWDGADLRYEEIEALGLCALLWQTVGGEAVRSFLASGPVEAGHDAVGLVLARLLRLGIAVPELDSAAVLDSGRETSRSISRRNHQGSHPMW